MLKTNVQLTCHQFKQIKIWHNCFLVWNFWFGPYIVGWLGRTLVALAVIGDGATWVGIIVEVAMATFFSGCYLFPRWNSN